MKRGKTGAFDTEEEKTLGVAFKRGEAASDEFTTAKSVPSEGSGGTRPKPRLKRFPAGGPAIPGICKIGSGGGRP